MMREMAKPDDRDFGDPSRRTYLAEERTLLAWWRAALAAVAVALGVGRVVPALTGERRAPYVVLGLGFGLLALIFAACGTLRHRDLRTAIGRGRYREVSISVVVGVTVALMILTIGAMTLLVVNE